MVKLKKSRSVSHNAFISALQIVLSTALMFALFRYMNRSLGVETIGVWSVVLATTSASRLGDLGLSTSVTRFVALYLAKDDPQSASKMVVTALLSVMVLLSVALPLAYWLFVKILSQIFQENFLNIAIEVLPFALGSLWLSIVASIFQSGLDGCQRMDKRALIVLVNQALMVFLAFLLIPRFGVIGLAWAQVVQGAGLFIMGLLILRKELPTFKLSPRMWSKPMFKGMLSYGLNVQGSVLTMMLFDPLTKVLMAKFGGPAPAGYFEIASQIVTRVRSVIVSANQAIVPRVVELSEKAPERIASIYQLNMRVIGFVAIPIFSFLFAWSRLFSWLMFGDIRVEFTFMFEWMVIAWLLNIFNVPAYFSNLGSGEVGWNTISHVVTGIVNALLGWLLGSWIGTTGVAIGYTISLLVGCIVLVASYQRRRNLSAMRSAISENTLVIISGVVLALGTDYVWGVEWNRESVRVIVVALLHFALVIAIWMHPMRAQFLGKLFNRKANTNS